LPGHEAVLLCYALALVRSAGSNDRKPSKPASATCELS
jgi:hypothetical protein